MPHLDQVVDYRGGLLSVAGPIIEHVAVGWIAPQQTGTGERPEKQHLVIQCVRQRNHGRGRAHIADQSKYLVAFIELLHCAGGPRGLVTIVYRDEPELAPVDSSIGIRHAERGLDAEFHILPELFGGTGEWRRNAKANFA